MRRAAMSLIALLAVPMLGGSAQARSSPEVGQRIRLLTRADSHWLVGKLVAQDGDSLRLLARAGLRPALFRVLRSGHVNVNQRERLVAIRALNAWLDHGRTALPPPPGLALVPTCR